MNKGDFTYLLQHPQEINIDQISDVRSIIDEFPYFQPARAIYLKGLKNKESFKYNQELKTTAAYTTDRSVLFDYITTETFDQNSISEKIKQNLEHLKDIELFDIEDLSISTSVSINEALKNEIKEHEPILEEIHLESPKEDVLESVEIPAEDLEEQTPEEKLEIGRPLEFDRSEMHSFGEWLKITSFKPIVREPSVKEKTSPSNKDKRSKKIELIDKFIQANPKIKPVKSEGSFQNLASAQMMSSESLMTETLARIYLEQKSYDKAIQAYKILSLKYPEKSGFFADQIKAVKQLQENNNK